MRYNETVEKGKPQLWNGPPASFEKEAVLRFFDSHNKALHLTTRASAIYESYSAIWGLTVVGACRQITLVAGELSRWPLLVHRTSAYNDSSNCQNLCYGEAL